MEEAESIHKHFQCIYGFPVPCSWMDVVKSDPGEEIGYRWEWADCCICKLSHL